jgi:hypothetical protein
MNKALLAAGAMLGMTGAAQAQTVQLDATPYGISVRVGLGLPIDSGLTDFSSNLFDFGFEYTLNRSLFGSGETFLSVGFLTRSLNFENGTLWPIHINQRFYGNYRGTGRFGDRAYTYVGLGVTIIDIRGTSTRFSARGGVGLELGEKLYTEAGINLGDGSSGVRPNFVSLSLGYRF